GNSERTEPARSSRWPGKISAREDYSVMAIREFWVQPAGADLNRAGKFVRAVAILGIEADGFGIADVIQAGVSWAEIWNRRVPKIDRRGKPSAYRNHREAEHRIDAGSNRHAGGDLGGSGN